MKRVFTGISGAALLLLTSGCSLMPADRVAPSSYRASLDSEVIAAVETGARSKGTHVYWINPPRKPKD